MVAVVSSVIVSLGEGSSSVVAVVSSVTVSLGVGSSSVVAVVSSVTVSLGVGSSIVATAVSKRVVLGFVSSFGVGFSGSSEVKSISSSIASMKLTSSSVR